MVGPPNRIPCKSVPPLAYLQAPIFDIDDEEGGTPELVETEDDLFLEPPSEEDSSANEFVWWAASALPKELLAQPHPAASWSADARELL